MFSSQSFISQYIKQFLLLSKKPNILIYKNCFVCMYVSLLANNTNKMSVISIQHCKIIIMISAAIIGRMPGSINIGLQSSTFLLLLPLRAFIEAVNINIRLSDDIGGNNQAQKLKCLKFYMLHK